MIRIELLPTQEFDDVMKAVRQWRLRAPGMMDQVAFRSARSIRRGVIRRLPTTAKALKKSLVLRKVSGLGGRGSGYAVFSSSEPSEVDTLTADVELLYVLPKKAAVRLPPEIQILANYNPWTVDTLPLWPEARHARVVSRKATKNRVQKVTKKLKADRTEWEGELRRAGVRPKRIKLTPTRQAIPDVAFESLRYEFGIGAAPSPHWRPAILSLMQGTGLKRIAKNVAPMLSDPANTAWSKPASVGKVGPTKIKKYWDFQKTLGIRLK